MLNPSQDRGSCLSPPKTCDHAPSAGSGDGPKDRRPKARADGTEADQRRAPRLSGASAHEERQPTPWSEAWFRAARPGRPSTDEVCEHEDDHGVKHGGAWALLWAASLSSGLTPAARGGGGVRRYPRGCACSAFRDRFGGTTRTFFGPACTKHSSTRVFSSRYQYQLIAALQAPPALRRRDDEAPVDEQPVLVRFDREAPAAEVPLQIPEDAHDVARAKDTSLR